MNFIQSLLFNLSIATGYKTKRYINVVWVVNLPEADNKNTIYRLGNYRLERSIMSTPKDLVHSIGIGIASELTCPINRTLCDWKIDNHDQPD